MIIWSGAGILIVLVFIACLFLGFWIFPDGGADRFWAFVGLTTAIFSWVAGMAWNTKKGKIVIDEETGEKIILIRGGGHKLFWIPMQYWGIILTVLTIIILFQVNVAMAIAVSVIFFAIIMFYVMRYFKRKRDEVLNAEPTLPYQTNEITETEEEILKRRAEKEDHNRFMPK